MIEDSITYPATGDWLRRIGIGGILTGLFFLVVPAILVFGYFIAALRSSVEGADEPPAFAAWGDLFVDGLKGLIITFVYGIVPTIVWMVVLVGTVGTGSVLGGEGGTIAGMLIAMLMFVPLMLLIAYLVPAALVNFATEDSIGAAFDVGALKPVYLSADYVIAVVLAFGVSIALNVVASILSATVVGLVLVPFLTFYAAVVMYRLYALGFVQATRSAGAESGYSAPTA